MAIDRAARAERAGFVRSLKALARRHRHTVELLARLDEERATAYEAARALDPPMTLRQLADIFGVSEAAITQHISRRRNRQG